MYFRHFSSAAAAESRSIIIMPISGKPTKFGIPFRGVSHDSLQMHTCSTTSFKVLKFNNYAGFANDEER